MQIKMTVRLHVPCGREAWMATLLQGVKTPACSFGIAEPTPVLNLAKLRCLNISYEGSGDCARTPFVLPLVHMSNPGFLRNRIPLKILHKVDWIVLGDDPTVCEILAAVCNEASRIPGGELVFIIMPFGALKGPLSQRPAPGDTHYEVCRNQRNFNQATWEEKQAELRARPEAQWSEVGISNVLDMVGLYKPFIDRLLPHAPKRILDLGCGLGQTARSLARMYPEARVIGMDSSAEAISVGQEKFTERNLTLMVGDFSQPLRFPEGSFDLIISANALPYAKNQRRTAGELMRMLAPGGLLLNYCRAEESHLLWDFPLSLIHQTNSQIFLADWILAAREQGLGTEVWSAPMGMTPLYFRSCPVVRFQKMVSDYSNQHRQDPPGAYHPLVSHVLLAHSANAQATDEAELPLEDNHFAKLSKLMGTILKAPAAYQEALIVSWFLLSKGLGMFPQLLDFCAAAMPESGELLQALLKPALEA